MLGWKGKGTQFDFLPMLLNGSDGKPRYYDLPDRLCMEVQIRHPTIEAITNLNLKWFGLPGKRMVMVVVVVVVLTPCDCRCELDDVRVWRNSVSWRSLRWLVPGHRGR